MMNIEAQPWNFPVMLQKTFLENGEEVPRSRAVVRTDQNKPICSVSDRYNLVPHKEVAEAALTYMDSFGFKKTPEVRFFNNGPSSKLVIQVTNIEKNVEVKKGDYVGIRVYFENSYNGKSSLTVRVGGLRLICLNGMLASKDIFNLSYRHSGEIEIELPPPKEVITAFHTEVEKWCNWADTPISTVLGKSLITKTIDEEKIFGMKQYNLLENTWLEQQDQTAWGLYNTFTNVITHQEGSRLSEMGRLRKLDKVGRFVNAVVLAA